MQIFAGIFVVKFLDVLQICIWISCPESYSFFHVLFFSLYHKYHSSLAYYSKCQILLLHNVDYHVNSHGNWVPNFRFPLKNHQGMCPILGPPRGRSALRDPWHSGRCAGRPGHPGAVAARCRRRRDRRPDGDGGAVLGSHGCCRAAALPLRATSGDGGKALENPRLAIAKAYQSRARYGKDVYHGSLKQKHLYRKSV